MDSIFFQEKARNLSRREASVAYHTDLIRQRLIHAIVLTEDMHRVDAEGIYSTPPSEPPLEYEVGTIHGVSLVPVMQPGAVEAWPESEGPVSSEWPLSESLSISGSEPPEPRTTVQDSLQLSRQLAQPTQIPRRGAIIPVPTQHGTNLVHHMRVRPPRAKSQETYCTCSSEAYGRMIECDICSDWFHFGCVSLKKAPKTWVCFKCR